MKFNYSEKQYDINFEGKEYTMVQRTQPVMNKIKELASNTEMTEYENNMALIGALFGDENATQMFPDGENTNLDKLAAFAHFALDLFMKEYKDTQADKIKNELKPYHDMLDTAKNISVIKNAKH